MLAPITFLSFINFLYFPFHSILFYCQLEGRSTLINLTSRINEFSCLACTAWSNWISTSLKTSATFSTNIYDWLQCAHNSLAWAPCILRVSKESMRTHSYSLIIIVLLLSQLDIFDFCIFGSKVYRHGVNIFHFLCP